MFTSFCGPCTSTALGDECEECEGNACSETSELEIEVVVNIDDGAETSEDDGAVTPEDDGAVKKPKIQVTPEDEKDEDNKDGSGAQALAATLVAFFSTILILA